ncbi:biopolymer transporter ExbD [Massilia sp. W12]|uniref:ExbD/TolR family protein n=1 Tax=Massilia sp. W12 TaxID=3126507 RepID=UPI0030D5BB8F
MGFGSFDNKGAHTPISEINVTPMVDVMLVLLVIFIITAPLFQHQIPLNLPALEAQPMRNKVEAITVSIDSHGRLFWNDQVLEKPALLPKLLEAAKKQPQPELRMRADNETRYEEVVTLMATARKAGLQRIGFVTEPRSPAPPAGPKQPAATAPAKAPAIKPE